MTESAPRRSPGRPSRASGSNGREAIVAAATAAFAEQGYDAVSLRSVARAAGVDPALIGHYFGGKPALFAACIALPFDPQEAIAALLAPGLPGLGERMVRFFLSVWDDPVSSPAFRGLVRGAASDETVADMLRQLLAATVIRQVGAVLDGPDAALRASLVGSQLVGLGFARYVVRLPALATASTDEVVALVAPTVQRYLSGA